MVILCMEICSSQVLTECFYAVPIFLSPALDIFSSPFARILFACMSQLHNHITTSSLHYTLLGKNYTKSVVHPDSLCVFIKD